MRYGFGTARTIVFSPTQQPPCPVMRRDFWPVAARALQSIAATRGRALRNAAIHHPSGNCCFTTTTPHASLLPCRHDARDVPPLPGDWQGTCTLCNAAGLIGSRQVRSASSLMWGGSKLSRAELWWWANNDRKRYAAPQTKAEHGKNREAACSSSSPRCWCCRQRAVFAAFALASAPMPSQRCVSAPSAALDYEQ